MKLGTLILLLSIGLAGCWLWLYLPHHVHKYMVSEAAAAAVRTWAGYKDLNKAKQSFVSQIERRDLPAEMRNPDFCEYYDDGGRYAVECNWKVTVWKLEDELPLIGQGRRLRFHVLETATH